MLKERREICRAFMQSCESIGVNESDSSSTKIRNVLKRKLKKKDEPEGETLDSSG